MTELARIGDLAAVYGISSRTLRYYEEIGLLRSDRRDAAGQRYYDWETVNRLEQILLLRKMELPTKAIQAILATRDLQVAVDAFSRKLRELDSEIGRLEQLRGVVDGFLALLKERGYARAVGLRLVEERTAVIAGPVISAKEVPQMPEQKSAPLDHVRLIQLKPMKVAAFRAESPSPEMDAWAIMLQWVAESGLRDLPSTRYFGFNNPNPTPDRPDYGYEVWAMVPEGTQPSGPVEIKPFEGGLFAVISTYLYEIGDRWNQLVEWARASDQVVWEPARQCLEETFDLDAIGNEQTQLDLLLPIRRK